ncbi:hypothetical protein [Citrobacter portucalensis]|uniref:hypothetical protein n=1 Tax=Citrobacter portucalensis TaxID=1639133 RepID=UPI00226B41A2|nr:hypothetical protein [Citrobacter portucalensis]MCX8984455.1 hypothetical protein [Citrobacter portucalensis]
MHNSTQPTPHTVGQLAIQYFEAVLTRDTAMLKDVYGYSKQDCDNIEPDHQQQAAAKLLAAGNILARKTPQPVATKEPATVTEKPKATFHPFAGSSSKFAAVQ